MALRPALGQEPTPDAPAPSPTPEAAVPIEHRSPRSTMRTFLTSVIEAGETGEPSYLDRAAECLDLSALNPLIRREEGRRAAFKLKAVLDRLERIDYDTIPDDPDRVEPWRHPRLGRIIISRQDNGAWLFSAATVAAIDELYREYESAPTVEGVAASAEQLFPELRLRSRIPAPLLHRAFLLDNWQWLALLLLTFAGVLFDRLVTALAQVLLLRRLRRWLREVEPELIRTSLRPFGLVAMAALWRVRLSGSICHRPS
jgi:hypothetical protein